MGNAEDVGALMKEWLEDAIKNEQQGPSPGETASRLGCSRSMVDKLVSRGLLGRTEFSVAGHHMVMISERSIQRVLVVKRNTGRWCDLPGAKE